MCGLLPPRDSPVPVMARGPEWLVEPEWLLMRACEQKYGAHVGGDVGLPERSAVLFTCKRTADRGAIV